MAGAENPFSRLLGLMQQQAGKTAGPAWGWGEVESVSPLRVAFQGVQLTEAQLADADKWAETLKAGDRVPVLPDREDGSFAIIGAGGGGEGVFAPIDHAHDEAYLGKTDKAADADKLDGNDSSAFALASHAHGNLTNDGKIGTTAALPLITGTDGAVQAGAFGTDAGQFCQGNDGRLSDARTPSSHAHGNISNDGKAGSTADLILGTGTAGAIEAKTLEQIKAILKPILLEMEHPVGSIWESEDSTSPATLFGGTWVTYGAGRVLVGLDSADADFDTVGEERGAKTHTLTVEEMPSHSHPYGTNATAQSGTNKRGTGTAGDENTLTTGGGLAHNNIQPSIVLYRWKRTA